MAHAGDGKACTAAVIVATVMLVTLAYKDVRDPVIDAFPVSRVSPVTVSLFVGSTVLFHEPIVTFMVPSRPKWMLLSSVQCMILIASLAPYGSPPFGVRRSVNPDPSPCQL